MSLLARFEEAGESAERRSSDRRELRLTITTSLMGSDPSGVTIHDLSESGLLLETAMRLAPGENFQIALPLVGAVETIVVWNSGHFYGCQFGESLPRAVVSAALLKSTPKEIQAGAASAGQDLVAQLRDANARIEQVGQQLDQAIEQLSSGRFAPLADPEAELTAALPRSPMSAPPSADVPLGQLPARYFEPLPLDGPDPMAPVVIISLVLAGLAVLILIAALLTFPLAT